MLSNPYGFTRVELVAALSGIALMLAVATPLLGGARADADRAVCANNLRQIGRAIQSTASERGGRPPWWVPIYESGTSRSGKPANAWWEFLAYSNELSTATVFSCPTDLASDPTMIRATDFAALRELHQKAISYTINVHAGQIPRDEWMSGDRNMQFDSVPTSCGLAGVNFTATVNASSNNSSLAWTNAVHGEAGNILSFDGRVEFMSTAPMRSFVLRDSEEPGASAHAIPAR